MMDITLQTLKEKIRPATLLDELDLPILSYTAIDVYKQCPRKYKLQYIDKKRDDVKTLALELGSLLHWCMEKKGIAIKEKKEVDYDYLFDCLENGVSELDEKTKEPLLGVKDLKKKYFEEWYEVNEKSGLTYEDKINTYKKVLLNRMNPEDEWQPYLLEHEFKFVWDNRVILYGFIDKVCINQNGDYKVIDYKSSNKVYDKKDTATALQMCIYNLAILNEFGKLPIENEYDFIVLDNVVSACSKGYENRFIKSFTGLLDKLEEDINNKIWMPKGSALCFWCGYRKDSSIKGNWNDECQFYCKWRPDDKTFEKNREFDLESDSKTVNTPRKLIF